MNGVKVYQLIRLYGSLVICAFCFYLPVELWFTEPEVAGLALLFIPIMNGFGLLLFLTWIDLYRKSTFGVFLNVIVIAVTLFLSLEGVFEFTGINRAFAGVIQISLAILTPLMALIHLYRLKRKKTL